MQRHEMEELIRRVYPGDNFAQKLKKMPDRQVHAMYVRLMSTGAFNKKKGQR